MIRIAKSIIHFFDLVGNLSIHFVRSPMQKQYAKKYFRKQLKDDGIPEEVINDLTRSYLEMVSLAEILDELKKIQHQRRIILPYDVENYRDNGGKRCMEADDWFTEKAA